MDNNIERSRSFITAGIYYLLIIIFGGFSEGYVRDRLTDTTDASVTTSNIINNDMLWRVGLVSDILMIVAYLLLGITLYHILKKVNTNIAFTMLIFNIVGIGILSINMLNHFAPLHLLTNVSYQQAFSFEQIESLSLFFLNLHNYGYILAQISTGIWLFPLGYLVYKSGFLAKIFGILLMIASCGYITDLFIQFLFPIQANILNPYTVVLPAIIAEVGFCIYLLYLGIKKRAHV